MASPRAIVFREEHVYHVFNRGVERRSIFLSSRDRERFVSLLEYYRFYGISKSYSHFLALSHAERTIFRQTLDQKPLAVDILAYCLMPNHFHLIVRQNIKEGIHNFLSNVSNGYAKYFNTKRHRVGPLYQGPFKAVFVETDEQLIHLSRYIHINPVVSGIISLKDLDVYPWSSFPDYQEKVKSSFIAMPLIIGHFKSSSSYRAFVYDQVGYAKELEQIKHLALEEV
ncbi:MAG: transposase [Patescibacteria group bacterium]